MKPTNNPPPDTAADNQPRPLLCSRGRNHKPPTEADREAVRLFGEFLKAQTFRRETPPSASLLFGVEGKH